MLQQHKLLIDQDCPMCRAYGQCFTKFKLVDDQTLSPYQIIDEKYAKKINMVRAKNEIALYDIQSQDTLYGYEALVAIIAQRSPIIKKALLFGPIKWIFIQLYFFISYNRKVIVPAKATTGNRPCVPDEQPMYRWFYILFVAFVTGYILNHFAMMISMELSLPYSPNREYVICLGQIIWQFVAIRSVAATKQLEYLGNMSTVSLIGGLLLIPILIVSSLIANPIYLLVVGFIGIVIFMLIEHIRRCKLLNIPLTLTFSWILFRVNVLIIIIASL